MARQGMAGVQREAVSVGPEAVEATVVAALAGRRHRMRSTWSSAHPHHSNGTRCKCFVGRPERRCSWQDLRARSW